MKKLLLSLIGASCIIASVNAQDVEPTSADTTWQIHGENTFLINQSSFSNWAAGGENSFAANLLFNYDFNYKKDKWSWDNKLIAGYGLAKLKDRDWRKNDDQVSLNSLLGYQTSEKWMYTFFADFKTQFTDGYIYDDAAGTKELISGAFAPAFLSFGPGMAFKESDDFHFNISPAAARFIFVGDDYLSSLGAYGVEPGEKSRFEFGASLNAYYKRELVENVTLENILKLYSNYLEDPQNVDVDYTANLLMKVNDYITVNAGVQLIYDDNTLLPFEEDGVSGTRPALQVKQILGAGLTYKF
ncbi:DUF3078 domain-containing protein [Albibacterium indicum]|uniref:DUF3078 domain-containing protein n=1 Tax=Albibacterium indicum TaxID=2292082 RepID=UPI000E53775D|nr:DUF3078 domain-containing protein [Pedobacter indicus]